jgi:hypothetical protein
MKHSFIFLVFISLRIPAFSQTPYPKITAYVGIVHSIVTFSRHETSTNFNGHYVVGMPTGINNLEKSESWVLHGICTLNQGREWH